MADLEVIRRSPFNAETPEHALRIPQTPSQHVYVRSNFDMPALDDSHVITVRGLVSNPLEMSARELSAMAQRTVTTTMECAGNDRMSMSPLPSGEPWRHGALSTASWTGVPLRDVIMRAGLQHAAAHLVFDGADTGTRDDAEGLLHFQRSLPVGDAMHADVLLALSMNGQPLAREHGAPVRLVVPRWYGMANVKWLSSIEAREMPSNGFFQRRRYVFEEGGDIVPVTRMRVKSIITSPRADQLCAPEVTVEGWAWSGHGSITRVELAVDGGDSWTDAQLGAPVSEYAWTPWKCTVSLTPGARVALRSRATDSAGNIQPDRIVWNRLGYGNNAVRLITVMVSDSLATR